jgi:hypothetical protein
MKSSNHQSEIDTIMSFILIKKLVCPITQTKAFKLGLINSAGKVIKEPKNDEENQALTLLDRIVLKIKRLLNTKLLNLNNFLYLSTISNDFYNRLVVRGTIKQRADIIRIAKDVKGIQEKYNINTEDLICSLIKEELENDF